MKHIYKCGKCGSYTIKEACSCGAAALIARPLKYSPNDRFIQYRRKAKIKEYIERGLI